MNEKRKQIIISEIRYWKSNKLLPAHFCDFLITLYAQGEHEIIPETTSSVSVLGREKRILSYTFLGYTLLALLAGASMFVITNYPVSTLLFAATVALILMFSSFRKASKKTINQFIYILSSFLLLGMSLKVWLTYFEGHTMLLLGLLMLNSALWLFAGRLLKLLYFTISGTIGLLLIIGFLFVSF